MRRYGLSTLMTDSSCRTLHVIGGEVQKRKQMQLWRKSQAGCDGKAQRLPGPEYHTRTVGEKCNHDMVHTAEAREQAHGELIDRWGRAHVLATPGIDRYGSYVAPPPKHDLFDELFGPEC